MKTFLVEFTIGNKRMRGRVRALHQAQAVQKVRDQLKVTAVKEEADAPPATDPKHRFVMQAIDDLMDLFGGKLKK
jgi:hypothetical protein